MKMIYLLSHCNFKTNKKAANKNRKHTSYAVIYSILCNKLHVYMKLSFETEYKIDGVKSVDLIKYIGKDIISKWVIIFQRNER